MGRPPNRLQGKYGNLTPVAPTGGRQGTDWLWLFRCACGRDYVASGSRVKRGDIRACGCRKGKGPRPKRFAARDRAIVRMDDAGMSLREIGEFCGITKQRVRAILLRERRPGGTPPCHRLDRP